MFAGNRYQGKGTRVNRARKGAVLLGRLLGYNEPFECESPGTAMPGPGRPLSHRRKH